MDTDRGDVLRLTVRFTDADGNPADPSTITLYHKTPGGVLTTRVYGIDGAVARDGVGVYHYDLALSICGGWPVRWEGTGAVQAAVEGLIHVGPSAF